MNSELKLYIQNIESGTSEISEHRKGQLKQIADYIREKDDAKLIFICTHNSRRSHLCQIWAATMAEHFGIENVETYSGGTEVTAFNPRAVAAIERAGFKVENPGGENPKYEVYFNGESEPIICFSKTFDDSYNPEKGFAAIMTCSDADENCPVVRGAERRFSIPYIDPKESDGTPQETNTYDERCRQIASEMYYMISQV
ncbi:protein-tyrosine-phosphatase [Fodinibius sp. Rm-B-1B1-1]|uniref:protein-tyrosine-phosphatase n=1 Tax=Fodinibius alkaliphilus TaxID=3140241 RepID=UPI00315B2D30